MLSTRFHLPPICILFQASSFCILKPARALSSVGSERTLHTRKVTGSIPVAPTVKNKHL